MSNGKRGDKHRWRPFKNRERDTHHNQSQDNRAKKVEDFRGADVKIERYREPGYERPRWTPPILSTEPLPDLDCPYCGKPIKELSLALCDKNSGEAMHFDCIINRLNQAERLGPGDTISYIGGGRFGVVHFNNTSNTQGFTIKKIFEWENKDNRAEWRQTVSDHFSVT